MKVKLAYGKNGLEVELPDHAYVLKPERLPPVPDPHAAITQSLRQPISSRPLREKVRSDDTVAIVFNDITRPTPSHIILPPILAELHEVGVPRESITLINGLGMHRPNTREELVMLVGQEIVDNYRIEQHNAQDDSNLTYLYTNPRGVPVYINSHYMNASVRILTGFIEPHIFAGWSGGSKAVLPAVAGAETIMANHNGPMIANPGSIWCHTTDNPIFMEMREVALSTNPTFMVNVTINEERRITGVFGGELAAAHDEGIAFAERAFVRQVPEEFDIAVAAHLGYPADINLYQSVKGLSVAAQGVRKGGSVILCAECSEGLGLKHFEELLQARGSPEELLRLIEDPKFKHFDQWGVQIGALAQVKVESYLYSSLPPESAKKAHMVPVANVEDAVQELSARCRQKNGGSDPRILVLPHGQLTVPRVSNGNGAAK
ncbi:MAG TPA: nickel-dependent lactate racemase [Dehalococcoidia bacterium]|nr:nickel-dependent lactate racemase [Dehalococcoidia bacterium]